MINAREALERLREGNLRFVEGNLNSEILASPARRHTLVKDQTPYAIILGCSDSRVPAELVFDQGLGHLFVIRVAGNVVAPSQIGSIEYAAEQFGTRLVVVLGHSSCGAVEATLQELKRPTENRSPNLRSIVGRISPSVEHLINEGDELNPEMVDRAVHANILASMDQLRHGSDVLEGLVQDDGLLIVGAQYSLENGVVDFFD